MRHFSQDKGRGFQTRSKYLWKHQKCEHTEQDWEAARGQGGFIQSDDYHKELKERTHWKKWMSFDPIVIEMLYKYEA